MDTIYTRGTTEGEISSSTINNRSIVAEPMSGLAITGYDVSEATVSTEPFTREMLIDLEGRIQSLNQSAESAAMSNYTMSMSSDSPYGRVTIDPQWTINEDSRRVSLDRSFNRHLPITTTDPYDNDYRSLLDIHIEKYGDTFITTVTYIDLKTKQEVKERYESGGKLTKAEGSSNSSVPTFSYLDIELTGGTLKDIEKRDL